jgi:AcrR family transcriptional regulator
LSAADAGKSSFEPTPVESAGSEPAVDQWADVVPAALHELQLWGIERFSVEAVAARAGIDIATIKQRWIDKHSLVVDALVAHYDPLVVVTDTGSLRGDLRAHLVSLAEYFNTQLGRSLLRTTVIDGKNVAPISVRGSFWKLRVDAVRAIFERAARRDELREEIDANIALQLLTGPIFLRGLYSNEPIDTADLCDTIVDLVLRAIGKPAAAQSVA